MFCAYCGKGLLRPGEKCQFCGNIPDPLRSFKKLDIDTASAGIDCGEIKSCDIYAELLPEDTDVHSSLNPPAKKSSKYPARLLTAILCGILIISAYICGSHKHNTTIVSDESYVLEGVVKAENNTHLLIMDEPTEININKRSYIIDSVYLNPDINLEDAAGKAFIKIEGKILMYKDNQFMLITEEEGDNYGEGI